MPRIIFVEHSGAEHSVTPEQGQSLMRAAVDNLVPGIDADCGGECACATCHVIFNERWFGVVGPPGEREAEMLDLTSERQECSRLSCQVTVTEALDGLRVQLPEFQF